MTTKHVNVRLKPDMHSRLIAAADRSHRSLNGQIEEYCERGLAMDSMGSAIGPILGLGKYAQQQTAADETAETKEQDR